jgi:hypothetical protein
MPNGKAAYAAFPGYKSVLDQAIAQKLTSLSDSSANSVIDLCRQSIAQRMIVMHLIANEETIDRLVVQGIRLLQAFHAKHYNDPRGNESEFLRGSFAGWRSTLHTEYHEGAEEIVDRAVAKSGLSIPRGEDCPTFQRGEHNC